MDLSNEDAEQISEKIGELKDAMEAFAEARKELADAETNYRSWRARAMDDVATRNPKWGEWKAKVAVEATPGYLKHKRAIAEARETYDLCDARKMEVLASLMMTAALHGANPAHWTISADSTS